VSSVACGAADAGGGPSGGAGGGDAGGVSGAGSGAGSEPGGRDGGRGTPPGSSPLIGGTPASPSASGERKFSGTSPVCAIEIPSAVETASGSYPAASSSRAIVAICASRAGASPVSPTGSEPVSVSEAGAYPSSIPRSARYPSSLISPRSYASFAAADMSAGATRSEASYQITSRRISSGSHAPAAVRRARR
jgi:hypothetical protein